MFNNESLAIFEKISDAFLVLDREWHITYINPQAEAFMEKKRADVLGKSLWMVLPETVNSTFYMKCHTALKKGTMSHFNDFFAAFKRWFAIRIYATEEDIFIYFLDITDQKEIEERARVSQWLEQAILDSLTATIAVLDQQGTIVVVNEAWKRFAQENGRYQDEQNSDVGTNYLDMIARVKEGDSDFDDAQKALHGIHAVLQGSSTAFSLEYPCHSPTQKRWFLMNVTSLPQLPGAVTTHIDITARRLAEEALRASETQAKHLLDSNSIGVIIADRNYILQANDAFLKLIGSTQEDVRNRCVTWSGITPPDYDDLDQKAFQELLERGVWTPFEKELYRKDGTCVPIEIGAAQLQDDPRQFICFVLDISERKEKALEHRKDDFIGMASHELRTPITALKGLTQLLERKLERQNIHQFDPYLSKMEAQITLLTKLIEDLLEVSNIQAEVLDYDKELIYVYDLLHEVVETLQHSTKMHIITLSEVAHQTIVGNREKLKQVFTNLLSNAIKFSPYANKVDVKIVPDTHKVIISVQDYGIGIPQIHQHEVFQRFYRVRDVQRNYMPGLGMGLYIANEIVQRHRGRIWLESVEGVGSTFYVSLPALS